MKPREIEDIIKVPLVVETEHVDKPGSWLELTSLGWFA
jgi:hypothetical protein